MQHKQEFTMHIGDIVKYNFPMPEDENKKFIVAIISFISDSKLVLDCEDGSCLMISSKNYDRIEVMRSFSSNKQSLVS
jgi:mRNA-degrading endonuclease HigB of HigAB toxin-antitoxin module